MNSIFICLFVFTLGSLAAKIPADVDKSETPDLNPESLEERNSELSSTRNSLITRRAVGKRNSDRWQKVNLSPVCFGTKNHQLGTFSVPSSGNLVTIKLVHLYGYVTCDTRHISYWSYWGCRGVSFYSAENINVVITNIRDRVLLPPRQFIVHHGAKWSKLPGYTSVSPELVLSFFHPYFVLSGEELHLWYGEDLMNAFEGDNGGRACVDIYVLYTPYSQMAAKLGRARGQTWNRVVLGYV